MKEFDNFKSWFTLKNKHLKNIDYLSWSQNKNAFSYAVFFYHTYYHYGAEFLIKEAEKLGLQRDNDVFLLIEHLDDVHETIIQFYEENYFPLVNDLHVQNIIKEYAPLTIDTVKRYILSSDLDLHLKAKAVAYMIATWYDFTGRPMFLEQFAAEYAGFLFGTKFREIFDFIQLYNKPLYSHLFEIKKFISKALHDMGYFDDYDPTEECPDDLSYIPQNFYSVSRSKRSVLDDEIPWKYVMFLNGELQIYHPRHPEGEGKHKPFYYKTEKSVKAFNQIKDAVVNKLPPIKAIFNDDDIIVDIDPASVDRINESLDILTRHVENAAYALEDSVKGKERSLLESGDYDNEDVLAYVEKKKSYFLNTLCDLHLKEHKIYYSIENRINAGLVSYAEDAFIFILAVNDSEMLLAYENAEDNRATYLFVCDNVPTGIEYFVKLISDYFSSGLVNKRKRIHHILSKSEGNTCLNSMIKVAHSDSNWKNHIIERINRMKQ